MLSNCIKDLLNLKGVIVKSIKNFKDVVNIYVEMPISPHVCPNCGAQTSKIHDYRTQIIKDIPIYFILNLLILFIINVDTSANVAIRSFMKIIL